MSLITVQINLGGIAEAKEDEEVGHDARTFGVALANIVTIMVLSSVLAFTDELIFSQRLRIAASE